MEARDLLLTIAEVAIAFAGFASLAAVVSTRSEKLKTLKAMRFQSLLMVSLTTVGLCFVPFVPPYYGFSESVSWTISSVLLVASVSLVNLALVRLTGGGGMNPTGLPRSYVIMWGTVAWTPVLMASLAVVGVGSYVGNYVVALLAMLMISALSFMRVITSMLEGE